MALEPQLRERIASLIGSDQVVLFMKGVRERPQCGFSAAVVGVLDKYVSSYTTIDVLADPALREGVKGYSEWPTIPQLYVRGEFIGGCDIVRELDQSGKLLAVLGPAAQPAAPPTITITDAAAQVVRDAIADAGPGNTLRLQIDARFDNDLYIGPAEPGDVEVESNGIHLRLDGASARRADGLSIDFVDIGTGRGFRLGNPRAPTHEPAGDAPGEIRPLTPHELRAKMDGGEDFELIDVRTPGEREIARIEGSRPFDARTMSELQALPRDTPLVFHCKSGGRSQQAAEHFVRLGFSEVYNLVGGIDAWARDVDPSLPRY